MLSLDGNNLFPDRESLVSDIPAGAGKPLTFFYSVGQIFHEQEPFGRVLSYVSANYVGALQERVFLYC